MKSLKIVLFSAAYPYRGGIAQFTEYLRQELAQKNEVEVVTFKKQYPDFLFPGKTQYVSQADDKPVQEPHRWLNTMNPASYFATAGKINRLNPDVYISRFWMPFFGPALGRLAKSLNKKCLRLAILDNVIPHEKRKFDRTFTNYFLKHHDGFICLSEQVKKELLELKPDARVCLINHPIYNQFGEKTDRSAALEKLNLSTNKKYLLFFGFIRGYKGLDVLLQAMNLIDPEIELIVAGEVYGSFDKYEEIISKYNLANRVHLFTDYIPDNEVATYFSAADVMVLPYKSATQSGLSAIALNFECPSIATNVGGLAEVVHHETNGLIVEPESPELLAKAIERYFKENLQPVFSEALKSEKEQYSWANFGQELMKFIESFDSLPK